MAGSDSSNIPSNHTVSWNFQCCTAMSNCIHKLHALADPGGYLDPWLSKTKSGLFLEKIHLLPRSVGVIALQLKVMFTDTSVARIHRRGQQGCARLRFFGLTWLWLMRQSRWLDSDSTQHFTFLDWLNSDSTKIPNLVTWLNSDSTHLSQNWVKPDSWLITFYLIWPKVVDRGWGGRYR